VTSVRSRGRRCLVTVSVGLLCLGGVTGCADERGVQKADPSVDAATLGLSGPWADDFARALAAHPSPYEREILADGRVTSAELEDAHSHVERCLRDSGLTIEYFPDGGFQTGAVDGKYPDDFFERSDPVLRACEKRYDEYVTMLFQETRRNPEKRDEAEITVACLRKAGVVGKDYSERQWRKEDESGEYSFPGLDPRAQQCRLDPLGLWRQG
jgi:hypothetical protein